MVRRQTFGSGGRKLSDTGRSTGGGSSSSSGGGGSSAPAATKYEIHYIEGQGYVRTPQGTSTETAKQVAKYKSQGYSEDQAYSLAQG